MEEHTEYNGFIMLLILNNTEIKLQFMSYNHQGHNVQNKSYF